MRGDSPRRTAEGSTAGKRPENIGLLFLSGADPLGMEGVKHWGWAGGFGESRPALTAKLRSSADGVGDAFAVWRGGCGAQGQAQTP